MRVEDDTVEPVCGRCDRVANAAALEESRGFPQGREMRGCRQLAGSASHNVELDLSIGGSHMERDALFLLNHVECCAPMFAWKESSAGKMIHERTGVAPRYVDAFM